ncbi:MAG: hypothetical protein Q6370_021275 [Candidatus Sigynarchaeota archaeon]
MDKWRNTIPDECTCPREQLALWCPAIPRRTPTGATIIDGLWDACCIHCARRFAIRPSPALSIAIPPDPQRKGMA